MQSELDVLVLEDFVLHKSEQPVGLKVWAEPGHNGASITPDPDSPGPTR